MTTERRTTLGLTGPLILIVLGTLFLLDDLGLVKWDAWTFLARFWPLLLITVGVDVLLGGRRRGPLLAAALVAITFVWFGWSGSATAAARPAETRTVSQAADGVERAEVRLAPGVARLAVAAGGDATLLIDGTVRTGRGETLEQDFRRDGNRAAYSLESRQAVRRFGFFSDNERRDWDLALSPDIPLDLRINAGVGEIGLDLSGLELTNLALDTGVGATLVILPASGEFSVTIESGVGETTVRLPEGLAARIHATRGIGSIDIDDDFVRDGDVYMSPGYTTAENRVDLRIDSGIGAVEIETYEQ